MIFKRQKGPLPRSVKTDLHHIIVQFANIRSKDTILKVTRGKRILSYERRTSE